MVDLPTSFDPPAYDESHLIFNEIEGDGLVTVSWPLIGIELLVTKREYPPHDEAMRHTPGLYFHGHSGYSIQEFHEFFLEGLPEYCSFRLGTVAVSMGEITPLGIFLFDRYYDDDVHGEWQDLASVRLIGVTSEYAEAYFLNAMRLYSSRYRIEPSVMRIEPIEYWDSDKNKKPPTSQSAVPIDLEPLRFEYHASRESDDSAACVQYYRILEFYAFFDLETNISNLRHDRKLTDRDFLVKVANTIARDERTPIIRLVGKLARTSLLRRAAKAGLIAEPKGELLGSAIYDFRNAVVHAKYDQRGAIVAQPVLDQPSLTQQWRDILRELATDAVERFGRKHHTS